LQMSENIVELAKALMGVQAALKPVVREKTNPFLNKKYADLAGIWEMCRQPLHDHNLAVVQSTAIDIMGPYLETMLVHESGQWISGIYPLKPEKANDPQALGSALTYARRYSLAALLGIVTEDDDAESAMERRPESKARGGGLTAPVKRTDGTPVKPATREQIDKLDALQKGGKNIKTLLVSYKWQVKKLSELSADQAAILIKDLSGEVTKNG
jgi:hypothetical protein